MLIKRSLFGYDKKCSLYTGIINTGPDIAYIGDHTGLAFTCFLVLSVVGGIDDKLSEPFIIDHYEAHDARFVMDHVPLHLGHEMEVSFLRIDGRNFESSRLPISSKSSSEISLYLSFT